MKRHLLRLAIPLKEPFVTAGGVVAERELAVVRLEDDDGVVGFGEAAPLEAYDGVSVRDVVEVLQVGPPRRGGPPQARTAWELAELDLQGRRRGRALAETMADAIPVNQTLPAGPPEEVAAAAKAGLRAGFSCFKVKVGLPDDVERVAAVRDAIGSWPALRVDANGAWSVERAVEAIGRLEPYDLELVEQPCATLEEMAAVRPRVATPLAADETVQGPEDAIRAAELHACDAVNVKLAGSGGFMPARATLRAAREAGMGAWLSSTLDGPWAIAAALQLASAEGVTLACGLATLDLFDARIARALPAPSNGLMRVPEGPGTGVEVDDEALAEVLVEELHG
ncbi:MAG: mandelate racemase/muconate lactonizing enzyme family protein [Solirubrobacteraceae bacterium]